MGWNCGSTSVGYLRAASEFVPATDTQGSLNIGVVLNENWPALGSVLDSAAYSVGRGRTLNESVPLRESASAISGYHRYPSDTLAEFIPPAMLSMRVTLNENWPHTSPGSDKASGVGTHINSVIQALNFHESAFGHAAHFASGIDQLFTADASTGVYNSTIHHLTAAALDTIPVIDTFTSYYHPVLPAFSADYVPTLESALGTASYFRKFSETNGINDAAVSMLGRLASTKDITSIYDLASTAVTHYLHPTAFASDTTSIYDLASALGTHYASTADSSALFDSASATGNHFGSSMESAVLFDSAVGAINAGGAQRTASATHHGTINDSAVGQAAHLAVPSESVALLESSGGSSAHFAMVSENMPATDYSSGSISSVFRKRLIYSN